MPDIENLTLAEFVAILPPGEPDLPPEAVEPAVIRRVAHYDAVLERIRSNSEVIDAWRRRVERVPPEPDPQTLQQLVGNARVALRRSQLTVYRTGLDRRSAVFTAVREELVR